MSKNNISFILHKPQLSENIGACARALKNFNFKKLVLINPKPVFPNDKILATSVGAKDIIKQSKNYDNLEKALSKIDILIATSARFRNKNIKHINLNDLQKINLKYIVLCKNLKVSEISALGFANPEMKTLIFNINTDEKLLDRVLHHEVFHFIQHQIIKNNDSIENKNDSKQNRKRKTSTGPYR